MRYHQTGYLTLVVLGVLSLSVAAAEPATTAPASAPAATLPTVAMPERVYKVLRDAIEAHDYYDKALREKNLAALDGLRAFSWPDYDRQKIPDFANDRRAYFEQAYVAAWQGKNDDAIAFMRDFLGYDYAVINLMDEHAYGPFNAGVEMLIKGEPRAKVLAQFEIALPLSHGSRFEDDLREMIDQLKRQVREDEARARMPELDPATPSQEERIRYFASRLADVHGDQAFDPGEPMVIHSGTGTAMSDGLVAIGRPALPALVAALDDRGPTRSVGHRRTWDHDPYVLRVQDVAEKCIEEIVKVRFYQSPRSNGYLSNDTPENRAKVIKDIKSWYMEHGAESELKGQIARLDKGPIYVRIDTLHTVEALDPKAVNPVELLKTWAETARKAGAARDEEFIAMELAARGDFSLRPRMRALAALETDQIDAGAIDYLAKFGEAEDYRFILGFVRQAITDGPMADHYNTMIHLGRVFRECSNPLAVPVLVAMLDVRQLHGLDNGVNYGLADECMWTLIPLTGHNEGYEFRDEPAAHFAAMDRWLGWWKKEGEAAFVKKYPDVQKVLPAVH